MTEGFLLRTCALLVLVCGSGLAQDGVVASAADRRNPELTPGGLAALYCKGMTGDPAKTTVEVNGQRAAVTYASEAQINFVVPEQVRPGAVYERSALSQRVSAPTPRSDSTTRPVSAVPPPPPRRVP